MGLMSGKRGIIFGVSNKRGIGYSIAKKLYEEGAEIAFTYAGDVMKDRVTPLAEAMGSKLILNCDVTSDNDIDSVVKEYASVYGQCDFIIHAVAFANREDLEGDFSNVSRNGWNTAMDVSAYSFVAISNKFKPYLNSYVKLYHEAKIGLNDKCYFFEDTPINLVQAKKFNWITILISRDNPKFLKIKYPEIDYIFPDIIEAINYFNCKNN